MICAKHDLCLEQLRHFVTHPGGEKVMEAFRSALELPATALEDARAVLAEHGNMSSATVLFVLERFMQSHPKLPRDEPGLVTAVGPGFSAEQVLFRT
jgi:alkylresorcinol/alkylpyrone synthase